MVELTKSPTPFFWITNIMLDIPLTGTLSLAVTNSSNWDLFSLG